MDNQTVDPFLLSTGFLLLGARESASSTAQHLCLFFEGHVDLIADGNQTLRQMEVVFPE